VLQLILVGSLSPIHFYDATLRVSGFSGMTKTSLSATFSVFLQIRKLAEI